MVDVCQSPVAHVGIKLLSQPQFTNCRFDRPSFVLTKQYESASDMNLRELRIEPFRQADLMFGEFNQSGIILQKHCYPCICIPELSMGECVLRVQIDRLLEEIHGKIGFRTSAEIRRML